MLFSIVVHFLVYYFQLCVSVHFTYRSCKIKTFCIVAGLFSDFLDENLVTCLVSYCSFENYPKKSICPTTGTACEPGLWRCFRTNKNVHDTNLICQGLGQWLPSPGCNFNTMLDRNSLEWSVTGSGLKNFQFFIETSENSFETKNQWLDRVLTQMGSPDAKPTSVS